MVLDKIEIFEYIPAYMLSGILYNYLQIQHLCNDFIMFVEANMFSLIVVY